MGYSTKPGSAALPKPHSTPSPSLSEFGGAFENTGGAVGDTQVVAQGPNLINWLGASADAYLAESLDIQDRAIQLQGVLTTIDGELSAYGETFQVLTDTTIPDYQEQWDEAITTHDENVEATRQEMETARSQTPPDQTFDDSSFKAEIQRQGELLEETQDELARLYNSAVSDVDDAAGTAASNIAAALDLYVPRGADGALPSRAAVGGALFGDNGGILAAQQHMEQGVEDAADANEILSDVDENGFPTFEALEEFNEKYGDRMVNDPFFATAFYDEFGIDRLNSMLGMIGDGGYRGLPEHAEITNETLGYMGAGLILATGGTHEVPDSALSLDGDMGQLARDRRAVWDAWDASNGGAMFNLGTTEGLDTWRANFQQEMIDAGRSTWNGYGESDDTPYAMGTSGYSAMMQIMALAGEENPDLALGDSFLNGPNSVAQDMIAWDMEFGQNWPRGIGLSSDLHVLPPGSSINPVYNMLGVMDGEGDAAQTFLSSDTDFMVDHDRDRDTDGVSMNMTRFLTGHYRLDELGQNWPDQGDSLGELLNDATAADPYSEESATIALNFMEGYTDGLADDRDKWGWGNQDRVKGEDVFGHHNSGLRSWAGFILDDYMADIADSMVTPSSSTGIIQNIDGEGFKIRIDDNLRDQLIGNDADKMFTDLAFDSPEQNEDGTWVGGRPPALNTLIDRSIIEMNYDLVHAMGEDGSDGMIHDANSSWSSVLEQLTTSNADMDKEVAAAIDERNSYLQGLVKKGVGAIPFGEILTTEGQKYAHGQVGNLGLLDIGLEALLSTDNAERAAVGQAGAHNAVEYLVREQFYSAVSQNTYWENGADPVDTFGPEGQYAQYDLLDDDNQFIPYSEMTSEQRLIFEEWVTDYQYGAGERFDEHVHDIEGNLNDAKTEGDEA